MAITAVDSGGAGGGGETMVSFGVAILTLPDRSMPPIDPLPAWAWSVYYS